jgi:hypothetical protein
VLTPHGILMISSPNRGIYPPGNPHHIREYAPEELRSALKAIFRHVELRRQHDWVASAILSDDELRHRDPTVPMTGAGSSKIAAAAEGSELYTIAIATDGEAPTVSARAVWTGMREPNSWFEEIRSLRQTADQLARDLESERSTTALLVNDHRDLREIEAALRADASQLLIELETARAALRQIHESQSWRLTRPLRTAADALRQRKRRGASGN